ETPFRPRRVHLTDGESIDIVSRRHVIVGEDYLDIGIQADDEPFGICETLVTVPLNMITRFEILSPQQTGLT
nr:hypothetical protein [Pirellulales bacterium]